MLASAGVVVLTAVAIWMLRPGSAFSEGTGGIANRQPRATWLVAGTLVVIAIGIAVVLRSRRWRRHLVASIAVVVVGSVVVAVVVGELWPGGLLRHYRPLVSPSDFNTETTPSLPSTTAPTATGAPGATTTPGATTAPAGTTVAPAPTTDG